MVRNAESNKKLKAIRNRLEEATSNATDSKRIGKRTECAIAYLIKYRDMKRILIAVMNLGELMSEM